MLAAAVTCGKLGIDPHQVVAISTTTRDSLEEYDTLHPSAAALNGSGDTIRDPALAPIRWASLDSVLSVNPTMGWTVASRPGLTGQLQVRVGNFFSNPIAIRTLVAADDLFAVGPVVVTDSPAAVSPLSASLTVELADTAAGASAAIPLAGRLVVYKVAFRRTPGNAALVTSDTARTSDTIQTVPTNALGSAFVKVRLVGGNLTDSVVVTARAYRATGALVPQPVTFTARFKP